MKVFERIMDLIWKPVSPEKVKSAVKAINRENEKKKKKEENRKNGMIRYAVECINSSLTNGDFEFDGGFFRIDKDRIIEEVVYERYPYWINYRSLAAECVSEAAERFRHRRWYVVETEDLIKLTPALWEKNGVRTQKKKEEE